MLSGLARPCSTSQRHRMGLGWGIGAGTPEQRCQQEQADPPDQHVHTGWPAAGVTHLGRAAGRGCRDPRTSEMNQREGDGQRVGDSQPGLSGAAKAAGPDTDILCVDSVLVRVQLPVTRMLCAPPLRTVVGKSQ